MRYYAVVFALPPPPDLPRCEPLFEGKSACKTKEDAVSTERGRHSKSLCDSKLCIVNLPRRSVFSTAGFLGGVVSKGVFSRKLAEILRKVPEICKTYVSLLQERVSTALLLNEVSEKNHEI